MRPLPAKPAAKSHLLPGLLAEAAACIGADDGPGAIAALSGRPDLVRQHPLACNTLAYLLMKADRASEALTWFEAALALHGDYVAALSGAGMARHATGDAAGALIAFDRVLALKSDDADAWYHRALALSAQGRHTDALASLDRAIAARPDYLLAFSQCSLTLEALGNLDGALATAKHACTLDPENAGCWLRLGNVLQQDKRLDQALSVYEHGLALAPDDFALLCNKAMALQKDERLDEALACGRLALAVDPENAEALMLCGNLERDLGHAEAALALFLTLARQGIARHYPAARPPARLRALLMFAPLAGNTPYEDLILGSNFSADLLVMLPDHGYAPEMLAGRADVVVNLVSEADLGNDMLAPTAALIDRLGLPVVNHPGMIADTDRARIALRLAGIENAVMPATTALDPDALSAYLASDAAPAYPAIIRAAGTHGGEDMELLPDAQALLDFATETGARHLYITDYVDYSSADGFFRKYRFLFVGAEILPYHLAIGDGWKVHHASTRMHEIAWMRDEESEFLDHPEHVFAAKGMAALDAIRKAIGLDYFGIDCGLDRDGNVVIFEVNASMLVHLNNQGFEYKNPHVMAIKAAFEHMLEAKVAIA